MDSDGFTPQISSFVKHGADKVHLSSVWQWDACYDKIFFLSALSPRPRSFDSLFPRSCARVGSDWLDGDAKIHERFGDDWLHDQQAWALCICNQFDWYEDTEVSMTVESDGVFLEWNRGSLTVPI